MDYSVRSRPEATPHPADITEAPRADCTSAHAPKQNSARGVEAGQRQKEEQRRVGTLPHKSRDAADRHDRPAGSGSSPCGRPYQKKRFRSGSEERAGAQEAPHRPQAEHSPPKRKICRALFKARCAIKKPPSPPVPLTLRLHGQSDTGAYPLPARGSRSPHVTPTLTVRAGSLSPACARQPVDGRTPCRRGGPRIVRPAAPTDAHAASERAAHRAASRERSTACNLVRVIPL